MATAAEARADDGVYSPPWPAAPFSSRPPPSERAWYGWQTFSVDLAVLASLYASGTYESEAVGYSALGVYVVGAPLVHLAHGRPGAAGGSLALRVGLPLVTGGLLHTMVSCRRHETGASEGVPQMPNGQPRSQSRESGCGAGPFTLGAVLGGFTAMILDMSILGFPPERTLERGTSVAPQIRVGSNGARAELTVRF